MALALLTLLIRLAVPCIAKLYTQTTSIEKISHRDYTAERAGSERDFYTQHTRTYASPCPDQKRMVQA